MRMLPMHRLQHASLATKIALLGLITMIVTAIAGMLGLFILHSRYQATANELVLTRQTRIRYALSTLEKEQQNFVSDYGKWDEMAEAVAAQDTVWLSESFIGAHETFDTDIARVYTADNTLLHTSMKKTATDPLDPSVWQRAISLLTTRDQSSHLHVMDTQGHFWHIMAGPIVSHTDTTQPLTGKLVVARKWDREETAFIENLLDATVTIQSSQGNVSNGDADSITITLDDAQTYQVTAIFRNQTLSFFWESLRIFLLLTLCAGLLLIAISHRLEYLLILNPLTRLTQKLQAQSVIVARTHECPNEIEMLDQMIESFLSQGLHIKKLSRIVDASTNAVALADLNGNLTYVNPSWEQLNGYTSFEVLGKNPRILQSGKTPKKLYTQMWDTLKSGQPFLTREIVNRRKDGSEYFCFLSVFPIQENGRITSYAAIQQDISQEKEVDRMKTEFISMASHQLRTPLSAMRWFGELLLTGKGGDLGEKQKEMVGNLQSSTMRMIALVNALLDITRLESGRIIIEPEPTDLDELVRSLLVELTPRIESKKLQLTSMIPADLPIIQLDKKMIREVYANLLTNAIKYTPENGAITITVTDREDDILTQVQDTGLGIPPAEHDKVFSKFYRGSNVQRVETDGTGLGLYLVKAIIESSGGQIWFESTPGKGTIFSFTIPKAGMVKKTGSVRIGS